MFIEIQLQAGYADGQLDPQEERLLRHICTRLGVSEFDYHRLERMVRAERGFRHTAAMHSRHLDRLSRMAREVDCSIFVKNAPSYAGIGLGGEGHTSFTIASPTGEGLTYPVSFSRRRRCVMVDHFRIV